MIIDETTINGILKNIEENDQAQEAFSSLLESKFEDYLSYLNLEILTILNSEEGDQLIFILSVLVEAFAQKGMDQEGFQLFEYFDIEEEMWAMYEENLKQPFRERVSIFFEKIDEEDALAFVEDSLIEPDEDDEEYLITATGRDVIWNTSVAFIVKMSRKAT